MARVRNRGLGRSRPARRHVGAMAVAGALLLGACSESDASDQAVAQGAEGTESTDVTVGSTTTAAEVEAAEDEAPAGDEPTFCDGHRDRKGATLALDPTSLAFAEAGLDGWTFLSGKVPQEYAADLDRVIAGLTEIIEVWRANPDLDAFQLALGPDTGPLVRQVQAEIAVPTENLTAYLEICTIG